MKNSHYLHFEGNFPIRQHYIFLHINEIRERAGKEKLTLTQITNLMSRLKADGDVIRLSWGSPSKNNVWILIDRDEG